MHRHLQWSLFKMTSAAIVCAMALAPGAVGSAQSLAETEAGARDFSAPSSLPQEEATAGEKKAEEKEKEEGKEKEKKEKEKPFEEVVKDLERIEGLFTFYRDPEEGKVYVEVRPEQFDRDYIYSSKLEQGIGEHFPAYGGMMIEEFVFQWRRLGKRVQFVRKNLRFRAAPDSAAARAVKKSFTDSVLSAAPRASQPHPERQSVLVDAGEIFLADLHGIDGFLKRAYDVPYKLNKKDSGVVMAKSFPKNSELGAVLNYQTDQIKPSTTVPDPRSVNLRVHYSLVELPENDYRPRLADDRIGYFMDQFMDYTTDKEDTPYVRYITRWHLKKKNPEAALSEPVEPLVFWLENSLPEYYRPFFREGVLLWNKAFEKIGFKNALVVKQQPDDAEWDPADIRYNTIRFLVAYDASFAIGPSHTNPYTGQILDADIGFTEGILRLGARRRYQLYVNPVQRLEALKARANQAPEQRMGFEGRTLCWYADELVEQASLAYDLLAAQPGWSSEQEKEFVRQFVVEVTAHEVGHTLGLRHNFRASFLNRADQLADRERTRTLGLAASVMDYNPPVIALEGEEQGDYFPQVVGSYDEWAVEYGYKPIPGATTPEEERAELRRIASQAADPTHPYATDFDAGLSARAIDPRNSRYDFTDDPLAWFTHEFRVVRTLWEKMDEELLKEDEGYDILRRSIGVSWTPYFRGAHVAMKYLGGVYHNRDHFDDPDGRVPYVPVPAAEQRRALEWLAREIWAAETFRLPAELLRKLQLERFPDFEGTVYRTERIDYPLHEMALAVQSSVFDELYHPIKLRRLQDLETLFREQEEKFTMSDLFVGVRRAIWAELESGESINSFRRNLQRAHLGHLVRLVLKPEEGTPEDAVTLARADLVELEGQAAEALERGELDYINRAHLEETRARIRQVLEAELERIF